METKQQEPEVDSAELSTVMSFVSETSHEGDASESPALLSCFYLTKFLNKDEPVTTQYGNEEKESPVIPVLHFDNGVSRERTCAILQFETSGISDERSTQFHSNFDPVDASQSLFTTISTSTTPAVVNDNDGDSDSMVKDTSTQSVSLFSQTKCSPTRESQIETREADDSAEEGKLRDTITTLCERLGTTANADHKLGTNPTLKTIQVTSSSRPNSSQVQVLRQDVHVEQQKKAQKQTNAAAKHGPENTGLDNDTPFSHRRTTDKNRPNLSSRDVSRQPNDTHTMGSKENVWSVDHTPSSPFCAHSGRSCRCCGDVNPGTCHGAKYTSHNISACRDPSTKKCGQKFKTPYSTQKTESLRSATQVSTVPESQRMQVRGEIDTTGSDNPIGTSGETKSGEVRKNAQSTRNVDHVRNNGEPTLIIDPNRRNGKTVQTVYAVRESEEPTHTDNSPRKNGKPTRNVDPTKQNGGATENNPPTKNTTESTPNCNPFTCSGRVALSCSQTVITDVEEDTQADEDIRKNGKSTRGGDGPGNAGENRRRNNPKQPGDLAIVEALPDRKGEQEPGNDNVIREDCSDVTLPPESDGQLTQSSQFNQKKQKLTSSLCGPEACLNKDAQEFQDIMDIMTDISSTVSRRHLDHAEEMRSIEQIRRVCDQTSVAALDANDKASVIQSLEKVIRQINEYQQTEKTTLAEKVRRGGMTAKEKSVTKQRLQSLSERCAALRKVFQAHHQLKKAAKSPPMNSNGRPAMPVKTNQLTKDHPERNLSVQPRDGEVNSARQESLAGTLQKSTEKTSRTGETLQRLQESHTKETLPSRRRLRTDDSSLQKMQNLRSQSAVEAAVGGFSRTAPGSKSKSSTYEMETDNRSEVPVYSEYTHKSGPLVARSNSEENENTIGIDKDTDNVMDDCSEMSQSILQPKQHRGLTHSVLGHVLSLGTTRKRRHSQLPVLKSRPESESLSETPDLNSKPTTELKRLSVPAVELKSQSECVTTPCPTPLSSVRSPQPSVDEYLSKSSLPKTSPERPGLSFPTSITVSDRLTTSTVQNEDDSRTKGDENFRDISHSEVKATQNTEGIAEEVDQSSHEDEGSRVLVSVHGNESTDTRETSLLVEVEDSAMLTIPSTQAPSSEEYRDIEVSIPTPTQTCVTSVRPFNSAEESSRDSAPFSDDTVRASQSVLLSHDILAVHEMPCRQQNKREDHRSKEKVCGSFVERSNDRYDRQESPRDNIKRGGVNERKDTRPRRDPVSQSLRTDMAAKSDNDESPTQIDSQSVKSSTCSRKRRSPSPPAPEGLVDDVTARKSAKAEDGILQPKTKRMNSLPENEEKESFSLIGQPVVLSTLSDKSESQAGGSTNTHHIPQNHKGTGRSESTTRGTKSSTKTPMTADGNNTLNISQRPESRQTGTCGRNRDLDVTFVRPVAVITTEQEQSETHSSSLLSEGHATSATGPGQSVVEVRVCPQSQGSLTPKPSQQSSVTPQTQQNTQSRSPASHNLAAKSSTDGTVDPVQSLALKPLRNKAANNDAAVVSRQTNQACRGNPASRPAPLPSASRRPSPPSSTATSMTDVFPVSSKEILRRMAEDASKRDDSRIKEPSLKPSATSCTRPANNSSCDDVNAGGDGASGLLDRGMHVDHANAENGEEIASDGASHGSVVSALAGPAKPAWQCGPKQLPSGTKVILLKKVRKDQTEKGTRKSTCDGLIQSRPRRPTFLALLNSGAVQPGKLNLSLSWNGSEKKASILADGRIQDSAGFTFSTPLGWYRAVTGMTNAKRSSAYDKVRYNGRLLALLSEQSHVLKRQNLDRAPPLNLNRSTMMMPPPPSTNPDSNKTLPPRPPKPPQRPAGHTSQVAGANGSQKNRCGLQTGCATNQSSVQRCAGGPPGSNQPSLNSVSLKSLSEGASSPPLSSASIVASVRKMRLIEDGEVVRHSSNRELASFWSADFAKMTMTPSFWATVDHWN